MGPQVNFFPTDMGPLAFAPGAPRVHARQICRSWHNGNPLMITWLQPWTYVTLCVYVCAYVNSGSPRDREKLEITTFPSMYRTVCCHMMSTSTQNPKLVQDMWIYQPWLQSAPIAHWIRERASNPEVCWFETRGRCAPVLNSSSSALLLFAILCITLFEENFLAYQTTWKLFGSFYWSNFWTLKPKSPIAVLEPPTAGFKGQRFYTVRHLLTLEEGLLATLPFFFGSLNRKNGSLPIVSLEPPTLRLKGGCFSPWATCWLFRVSKFSWWMYFFSWQWTSKCSCTFCKTWAADLRIQSQTPCTLSYLCCWDTHTRGSYLCRQNSRPSIPSISTFQHLEFPSTEINSKQVSGAS